ncbi:MAG: ATP-binding protein [Bacteroidota bacterium]
MTNPFATVSYIGPQFFCDREEETSAILANIKNGRNTLLISPRRLGKTSLIRHVFGHLKKSNCLYIDLNNTSSVSDLLKVLTSSLAEAASRKTTFRNFLSSWKISVEFDPYTGSFTAGMNWVKPSLEMKTVEELFQQLSKEKNVIIAFDEFQRITEYPDQNTEGWLRSIAQKHPDIRFIYSGSHQRVLEEMFNVHKRPFYKSTDVVRLGLIKKDRYGEFIAHHFKSGKISFSNETLIPLIYDQMSGKTAYIQDVCNRIYDLGQHKISEEDVFRVIGSFLDKYDAHYSVIKRGLTQIQFNVLWAVAKLGKVYAVTGTEIAKVSGVSNAVSVQKSVTKLLKIEVLYSDIDEKGEYVTIDDVFLILWLLRIKTE